MGRPREFDSDDALEKALNVFWRQGYEGASLTDLTDAMGITRPSLYATFGNKEDLFRKALDRYNAKHLCFVDEALKQPTARLVAERVLIGFAEAQTQPTYPPGCMGTGAAVACSDQSAAVREEIITKRVAMEVRIRRRLDEAKAAGDLPADAEPADLASYLMTVVQGMAVKAAGGDDRSCLCRVVKTALMAWPTAA
ncbi:TetR/AcrR family transcriptional regulator [Lacibacterium aquatile]|uniref:TetR/AcrR family transcriptional regulator n=1 Tax=Lacibacterium aquatile TaxID=1168082 RepID=A0ABW5DVP7_9PROT